MNCLYVLDLEKEKYYLLLGILIFIILIIIVYMIKNAMTRHSAFNETMISYKQVIISMMIDLDNQVVEKYYAFDQKNKNQIIPLDEFYFKFDKYNLDKLIHFMSHISRVSTFNKTRRVELVMYENNRRRIYMVELDSYDAEHNRYFMTFRDKTESVEVFRRVDRTVSMNDFEKFYDRVNERLDASEDDSINYIVSFKYREFKDINRDLRGDFIKLIDSNIYSQLDKVKFEKDLLCQFNDGVFLLFASNINNVKRFKQHIKHMININSRTYYIAKNQFTISLVAGITMVKKTDVVSTDKSVEAETAADVLINKAMSGDKIQFYDEALAKLQDAKVEKLIKVQGIITDDNFKLLYQPILESKKKTVIGYSVDLSIPSEYKLEKDEFVAFSKEIGFRKTLFIKIFDRILLHYDVSKKRYFILVEYTDLDKVMEAYSSNVEFAEIDLVFCVSFNNFSKQNHNDVINIEKDMNMYRKEYNVKFGINYNSLQTIYLNDRIYTQANFVIFSGQLVEKSLDSYINRSLIDVYTEVANKYGNDIIAIDLSSLALYETFYHYKVKLLGGAILSNKISDGKLKDRLMLKTLSEIEEKTY